MIAHPLHQPPRQALARTAIASVCIVLSLAAHPFAQAGDEAFKQGVDALKDRRFVRAVGLLLQARSRDGRESMRKIGATRLTAGLIGGEPYLPLYYLGVAYATLGNCHDAVTAFEQSERQGVIIGDRERHADLQARKQACIATGVLPEPEYTQRLQSIQQQVDDARLLASSVGELSHRAPQVWGPSFAQEYARATADVGMAAARLSSARVSRLESEFNDARTLSERAAATLRSVKADLDQYVRNLDANVRAMADATLVLDDIGSLEVAIDSVLADAPVRSALPSDLTTARVDAGDRVASLRARIEQASAVGNGDVSELTGAVRALREQLRKILADARTAVTQQVATQFDAALNQIAQAATDIETKLAAVDGRLGNAKDVSASTRVRLRADLNQVRRQIGEAKRGVDKARGTRAPADLARVRGQLSVSQVLLRAVEDQFAKAMQSTVPAALALAANQFLSGAYAPAIEALPDSAIDAITDSRWRMQAYLFRAAALFSLSILRNPADDTLRARAAMDVVRCRQLDPAHEPDATRFSPQFRAFYKGSAP